MRFNLLFHREPASHPPGGIENYGKMIPSVLQRDPILLTILVTGSYIFKVLTIFPYPNLNTETCEMSIPIPISVVETRLT